jgi:hypothetical protein
MSNALGSFAWDKLIAGSIQPVVPMAKTLLSGQNLVRGTLVGRVLCGAVSETHVGNTGTGSIGTPTRGTKTKAGVYKLVIVTAVANAGRFVLYDPDGIQVGDGNVGVAFVSDHLNFTLADATDFVVGDTFLITVAAGSGKIVACDKDNIDGSAQAYGILAADADATSGDVPCVVYVSGEFNEAAITFQSGESADTRREELEKLRIFLRTTNT